MARIRTITFLPEIFQTSPNAEFLGATLDQLVSEPTTTRIQGYVGSKFGNGVDATDYYVIEPTKTRADYQLTPSVVMTKVNESTPRDFITYPGIIDTLKLQGAITDDNARLFESQFYSWDSFCNLDPLVNYDQYYWLPEGPPAVTVAASPVFSSEEYTVSPTLTGYDIVEGDSDETRTNPTITLKRGGTYVFKVDQSSQFWIQTYPGVAGVDPRQSNISSREVYGVDNNGASTGFITFTVPLRDAQQEFELGGDVTVDLISTVPYSSLNGALLSEVSNIDGISDLLDRTVMFYNTGDANSEYDYFHRIAYSGTGPSTTVVLVRESLIPNEQRILPVYGTQWINRPFYRTVSGIISLLPQITAPLDTLYYQDSANFRCVGTIRLIDSDLTNEIEVDTDIIGKPSYTAPNGVVLTNGLKIAFDGAVYPSQYLSTEYYVAGVGTAIELIPVDSLSCPERFTIGEFNPWDVTGFDTENYDIDLYLPVDQDYITIARNSINRNAWSRSNRWFHSDVIKATAEYNNNSSLVSLLATQENKAKRPIIEFYPNIKLFNSGTVGKAAVDFFDTRATDALSTVAGSLNYYPDVEVYTGSTSVIASSVTPVTTITVTVPTNSITGTFQAGMYVGDNLGLLPLNAFINEINTISSTEIELVVNWNDPQIVTGGTTGIVASSNSINNYGLFNGARIVFAADTDQNVRDRIYIAEFASLTTGSTPVIVLTPSEDTVTLPDEMIAVNRGFKYQGKSLYFTGSEWLEAQQKITVNQAPLFDIFDANGISFGDASVYTSTSFNGCSLFSYGLGTGTDDPIVGFPIRYSSVGNIGDISFDVTLNSDTFGYVSGNTPIISQVNSGYVHSYNSTVDYTRLTGWQTASAPSTQYQLFNFDYDPLTPTNTFTCDIAARVNVPGQWPSIKVYVNNVFQTSDAYSVVVTSDETVITLVTLPTEKTAIQIEIISDQVSDVAYYSIPINLSNNPFNQDITEVNLGDVASQYNDIYINSSAVTGDIYGPNNYRDCGNLVQYGTKIIQNSASMALAGSLLRSGSHNLFDALLFNSREYIKYKQLLVDTVANIDFTRRYTASQILETALDQITAAKSQINAFFWSDMIPSKNPFRVNTYTFNNNFQQSAIFPLSQVYDLSTASYNGVLVYLTRTVGGVTIERQLVNGVDYTVSSDTSSLSVSTDLVTGDIITIKEYNQTYGSYVPNTPTKLGLYPSFVPSVVLDSEYQTPTYFIRGHDGSYTKLYGAFIDGQLIDFRDQALLEFETRIFNNLKLSATVPISRYEVVPGFFRDSSYTWSEFVNMYSTSFLNWIGQNRVDYKTQYYNRNDEFTYNYTNSGNKLNGAPIEQGYWRGVYEYFYDTTTPNTTPWEMLGFADQPSWWTEHYGPAPYTSDNEILWSDLENGLIWNDGAPYIVPELARPGLSDIIPVDSNGQLLSPLIAIVGNYNPSTFQKDWKVGDDGPAELSYRRSSSYPFDLMRLFALTRPAEFFNLAVDLDNYKYNAEFNQYLVNDRYHLDIASIEVYGNGTAKTSYLNWIVDYEKQQGIDATTEIKTLFENLDVRLVHRLAGYTDKTLVNFYVEKGSPDSQVSSLMIPDESYSVLLYDNQPFEQLMFSGIVIQQNNGYWTVYGNSQTSAYFTTASPLYDGKNYTLTVEKATVKITENYSTDEILVPYGTRFYSTQEVSQFIMSYGQWLINKGMLFDNMIDGLEVNWQQMVLEFLYWTQTGWENGSIITLNPAAETLKVDKSGNIVQPLTIQNQNFILNQNLYPINVNDLCVSRDETLFKVHTLNDGDTIAYAQFNMSNFEHAVVFDNLTLFNDVIYDLVTGLRQNRIYVRGSKTAEWNGTVNAAGFILNQDNIKEWSNNVKYTPGVIVKHKNKYWTPLAIIEPTATFNENDWKLVNYDNIQKGLLPNAASRAYESTLYYDTNEANLERDADLLSFSLIGYRPRNYLELADLTDVAQVNVYKNLIQTKGTRNAVEAFNGAELPLGGIQYDVYENWAIKTGEYGGVLNQNFVDMKLEQSKLTGNPSIVSLTQGIPTTGSMQEIPINNLFNYGYPIDSVDILKTVTETPVVSLYPSAGYVNFNDVKMSSYFYSNLPSAVNATGDLVSIDDFYVNDVAWLANFKQKWDVFSWRSLGQINQVRRTANGNSIVRFENPHGLIKHDPIAIINFSDDVNGYYIVVDVVNLNEVLINLELINSVQTVAGAGLGFKFVSQRVDNPAMISSLSLIDREFVKDTVWVDEDSTGEWAVYRKDISYSEAVVLEKAGSSQYGTAVAYSDRMGYLVSDATTGNLYRYVYSPMSGRSELYETVTGSASFGTSIAHADRLFVVSEPTSGSPVVKVYTTNDSRISDNMVTYQTIPAPIGVTNWGSAVDISGDTNWLLISDVDNSKVHVYQRQDIDLTAGYFTVGETYVITELGNTDFTLIGANDNVVGSVFIATGTGTGTGTAKQVTFKPSVIIDATDYGIDTASGFGKSLTVNYNGQSIVIGAPERSYSVSVNDWGSAYVFARSFQNIEIQSPGIQAYPLAWTVSSLTSSGTSVNSNYVSVSSTSGFAVNDPVVFTGTLTDSNVSSAIVYYIQSIVGNTFSLKTGRSTNTPVDLTNVTGINFTVHVQKDQLTVTKNGITVTDNNYAIVNSDFVYYGSLNAGDIISVNDNTLVLQQTLTSAVNDRTGIHFAQAMDSSTYGDDVLIGAPFEIDAAGQEGAVYHFVNSGAKYGNYIGTRPCQLATSGVLLINGYPVNLTAGNAEHISYLINISNITNVTASATPDNKLIIQLIDPSLSKTNQRLLIASFDADIIDELGIDVFSYTQTVKSPHVQGPSQFGSAIKINEANSVAIAAPVGTRFQGTQFDFTDDVNFDNDTVFDNNATQFVDEYQSAGAVYVYDYLGVNNESVFSPGAYVYAQSVNTNITDSFNNARYGSSIDFNGNVIIAGAPGYDPIITGGQAAVFINESRIPNWHVLRSPAATVDVSKIQNSQIYDSLTNNTLINLDYIDPLQGKILGIARENIDYVSAVDPAKYNSPQSDITGYKWGQANVGQIWLNVDNIRFVNYHQNDVTYNSQYWGSVFPGSDVAVYTWISSFNPPSLYTGPGTPYSVTDFAIGSTINSSNIVVPVYYFWVRNSNTVYTEQGKSLADSVIADYISDPKNSGIAFMAPLLPNTFALYNSQEYINAGSSVFHIGYANGSTDDAVHNEFALIRENYADDFLPGIPQITDAAHFLVQHPGYQLNSTAQPYSLYAKLLDSLSGCDTVGEIVPNPFLPKAVQSGILANPRQSFFYNRFLALKNYLEYVNSVLIEYPITEQRPELSFLFTASDFYDTAKYWEYVNWWATGYDDSTRPVLQVATYADLSELVVETGTIVTVAQNGAGKYEVYRNDGNQVWTRIGLETGTIQFKSSLWDYSSDKLGFGDNFFDTTPFDEYPSEETRNIVRAINEQILIDELLLFRNRGLMLLFAYIQSETVESQNFLPWLNKTSLVDVSHVIRELLPYNTYKADNQDFLSGYVNEVKPYHVVIKDFLFKYTGTEPVDGNVTDFDLPATYNDAYQQFITPELVYENADTIYQYTSDDIIWSAPAYIDWISNYGLSITGQPDFQIAILKSFVSLTSQFIIVDNANGFPETGTIKIDEELISYASIDRSVNTLSGLTRGIDGTPIQEHIFGASIIIDLPPVMLYDGGRGYTSIPRVTAVIDTTKYPAPARPAQLEAIMSNDRVSEIRVIDAGQGYATTPSIEIEPAYEVTFTETAINSSSNTISLNAPLLQTGDLVRFTASSDEATGLLVNNQWYYVRVLDTVPEEVIALFTEYSDAIKNTNRIRLVSPNVSATYKLSSGARAIAVTSSSPVRENNIKLRYDRTSYTSQITDWQPGRFYGSYFAGSYYSGDDVASSSIKLENVTPNIDSILASAQGVSFYVSNVTDQSTITWSSLVRRVSSTAASNDTIKLIPLDNNNPDLSDLKPYASGSTIGFEEGMPIKFVGAAPAPLVDGATYYIRDIVSELEFTISETVDGSVLQLNTATISAQGLECYTGEINNTVTVSLEYPGILTVTETESRTNRLVIPTTVIGSGGTSGFYTDLPVFFSGNVFGGVVANQVYYVTTVIDEQTFTMSETTSPLTMTASDTVGSSDQIIVSDANYFAVNDPIIFTEMTGDFATSGIVAGETYYISDIVNSTAIVISPEINGVVLSISDITSGSALITNQRNTVTLTDAVGEMTINVSLPVSPGQVDGQRFSFYPSSKEFPGVTPVLYENLIQRTITSTLGTNFSTAVNKVTMSSVEGDTNFFYVNMPVRVDNSIGGLLAGTTYYITEYSGELIPDVFNPGSFVARPNIQVIATQSSSATNAFTVDSTTELYPNMPIIFDGTAFGGVVIGNGYYVDTILNSTQFTVKIDIAGSTFPLTDAVGTMVGIGDPYIVLSTTPGGPAVSLTTDYITLSSFVQFVETVPVFDISYMLGGYVATIANPSPGLAINNRLIISGADVGGSTPANDVTLTINEIGTDGAPTSVICSGVTPGMSTDYYLKVVSETDMLVYEDPSMVVPVGIDNFPYVGFTEATVTSLVAATDRFVVSSTSDFNVNDIVVFTGDTQVVQPYQKYFVYEIVSATEMVITAAAGDAGEIVTIASDASVNFTIAKQGAIALLPQPFYFNESIVRYNNRLYVCTVSNNDDEFTFGKWELINSDDRRLNAMDRTVGYYQPDVNMPGLDLTQLFDGVTYPYSIYKGNAFQPSEQFDIDTRLSDQPFYPSNVNTVSVIWDGESYRAVSNMPTYSAQISSATGSNWDVQKLSSVNVGLTSINYLNNYYLVTSQNTATPLTRSIDGTVWNSTGYILPYAGVVPFDVKPLGTTGLKLNSVAYANGFWVAVGNNIARSADTYNWTTVTNFTADYQYDLRSVVYVELPAFTGFIAAGSSLRAVNTGSYNELISNGAVLYSTDGENWTEAAPFTENAINSLAISNNYIVAVGNNGIIYYSQNGAQWFGVTEVAAISVNGSTNELNVTNTSGLIVNDRVRFNRSFSSITANTTYYVKTIVSSTQITLSTTSGGSTLVLTAAEIPARTFMTLNPVTPLVTLNSIAKTSTGWIAVGNTGRIITSANINNWTSQVSGTTQNLYGIAMANGSILVVGNDNVIIESTDSGTTWNSSATFNSLPTVYDVRGADFTFGYGPEEMVPGNLSDNLTMIVNTRPGTNWFVVDYGSTGYSVASVELTPETEFQVDYSFAGLSKVPVEVSLQIIDSVTGLATTLYSDSYTVDWINKIVTLATPLQFSPVPDRLLMSVYDVGNGYQLVKSNTDVNPIFVSSDTGFNEINLNCAYSADVFDGGGVLRSDTVTVVVPVTETAATTNTITCESVNDFIINSAIEFEGTPFGNLAENTTYYIKEINSDNNTIIISDSYDVFTGLAGPAFVLTDATGLMSAIDRRGNGVTWSTPYIVHNGTKLIPGITGTVVRSEAATDVLITSSTLGLIVDSPIMFDNDIFGGITGLTTYYVHSIVDETSFKISATSGGAVLGLTDATGGSSFIQNDYAFGIQDDGINAKIVFSTDSYTNTTDYIAFSIFGESDPEQYEYSLPETELFTADGINYQFTLSAYAGGTNPANAIVEIDGIRLNTDQYVINSLDNTITFVSVPTLNSVISVTTYNDTRRQYFHTASDITGNIVSSIVNIENTIVPASVTGAVNATTAGTNVLTLVSPFTTTGMLPGQTVTFKSPPLSAPEIVSGKTYQILSVGSTDFTAIGASANNVGVIFTATGTGTGSGTVMRTTMGNVSVIGTSYFVDTVVSSTSFTIKDAAGTTVALTTDTGYFSFYVDEVPTVRITTKDPNMLSENDRVRLDGILGSTELNNGLFYVKIITPYIFDIYERPYVYSDFDVNYPVTGVSAYESGGFAWLEGQFQMSTAIASATQLVGSTIVVDSADELIFGTPVYFAQSGYSNGDTIMGGLVQGTEYYVRDIFPDDSAFTVSAIRLGETLPLTSGTGTMFVSQWKQSDKDRLYVTVNGLRVPPSKLVINDYNNLSILTEITSTDSVTITSMIPTSTPDQLVYVNNVDSTGAGEIYSVTPSTIAWLTEALYDLDVEIKLNDVTRVTDVTTVNAILPIADAGYYYVGIESDKRAIKDVSVYDNTTATSVPTANIEVVLINNAPKVRIALTPGLSTGDSITITVVEGDIIYINGEQIGFGTVDFATNTLGRISRGVNGTAVQPVIPANTLVYAIKPADRLASAYYDQTWNSYNWNSEIGDPLQISTTIPADFLNRGITP